MRAVILDWGFAPGIIIPLIAASLWYGAGIRRMRRKERLDDAIDSPRMLSFAAGIAVLVIALLSPLDAMGEALFSAHMSQHLLLLLVAPPLLIWGRPELVMLWALPAGWRKRVGQLWAGLGFGRGIGWLMHPAAVWLLFTGSFVFWHMPVPYGWAAKSELLHALEHTTLLGAGLMFWSIVIAPAARIGAGAALIFLGTTAIFSGLPGAIIFLAPRPLYPIDPAGTAAWGLTLMQDQQLAGVTMWIPGGLVYLIAVQWAFLRWLREAERRTARASGPSLRRRALLPGLALAAALLAAQSGRAQELEQRPLGNPDRGATLIRNYGCGTCHVVPGIAGANGRVGPPLTEIGRRIYLAGLLRNTPENMIAWLEAPQSIVPGNAMPDMGISGRDARDITAYLEKLR